MDRFFFQLLSIIFFFKVEEEEIKNCTITNETDEFIKFWIPFSLADKEFNHELPIFLDLTGICGIFRVSQLPGTPYW